MALPNGIEALDKAFSGIGVDEKLLIGILAKSNDDHKKSLRTGCPKLLTEDENGFQRLDQSYIINLQQQFNRLRDAVVLSLLHPWERDARLIEEAIKKGPKHYNIIVEIACTRSSNQLLGARKAYHSIFDSSIEEDLATHVKTNERKFLAALVSAYRYEGPIVKEDVVKSEVQILYDALNNGDGHNPLDHEDAVMILTTRSKPHLQALYQHYNKTYDKTLTQDLEDGILKDTIECLCTPEAYFSRVMEAAVDEDADEDSKASLSRVIVTQQDVLMKEGSVPDKIPARLSGLYKDFLLGLITSGDVEENKS